MIEGYVTSTLTLLLQIKETQKQIKKVLQDRWTAWYEARDLWNSGLRPGQDQVSRNLRLYGPEADVCKVCRR